jgi:antitoxin (DNA-binding transcriptional repressor) of toxin-antitoxin stability system
MKTLNVASARNCFSQLVDEVHESGDAVIVAKYGHPFVMIVPVAAPQPKPSRYPLRGLPYCIAEDFDAPMPELASMVAESSPEFDNAKNTASGKRTRK